MIAYYPLLFIIGFIILVVFPVVKEYWKVLLPLFIIYYIIKWTIKIYIIGRDEGRWI